MMRRAIRSDIGAEYWAADAWFGSKPIIRTALGFGVCAILRMKKGNMKYRITTKGRKKELLDAKELYAKVVKRE